MSSLMAYCMDFQKTRHLVLEWLYELFHLHNIFPLIVSDGGILWILFVTSFCVTTFSFSTYWPYWKKKKKASSNLIYIQYKTQKSALVWTRGHLSILCSYIKTKKKKCEQNPMGTYRRYSSHFLKFYQTEIIVKSCEGIQRIATQVTKWLNYYL